MSRRSGPHPAVAPALLVLALLFAVGGFGMLVFGEPRVDSALHRARVQADDAAVEVLEDDLESRRWRHRMTTGALFAAAVVAGVFGWMGTSSRKGFQ